MRTSYTYTTTSRERVPSVAKLNRSIQIYLLDPPITLSRHYHEYIINQLYSVHAKSHKFTPNIYSHRIIDQTTDTHTSGFITQCVKLSELWLLSRARLLVGMRLQHTGCVRCFLLLPSGLRWMSALIPSTSADADRNQRNAWNGRI